MTGRERAEKAHVVLSTLWEIDVTKAQVCVLLKVLRAKPHDSFVQQRHP